MPPPLPLYGISDFKAFSSEELEHIKVLYAIKEDLKHQEKHHKITEEERKELEAFVWVFTILDEVSREWEDWLSPEKKKGS